MFGIYFVESTNPNSLLVEDQAPDLYALSSLGVTWCVGVNEGCVRGESGNTGLSAWLALTGRVKTFDEHGLVWRHVLHILFGRFVV